MEIKTIFLASSAEMKADRDQFEIFISRKNSEWVDRGVHLRVKLWEDFLDRLSPTRLQDEYNGVIRGCDLFVMLFCSKVGRYTEEEFEVAVGHFKATSKPFIYTYFRHDEALAAAASDGDQASLRAFQDKLKAMGHYQTEYRNTEGLLLHFGQQLDKLVANGFISFPADDAAAAPGTTTYTATLQGSGAVAQGTCAQAVGAGGVLIGGNNSGYVTPASGKS